jgi:hypothetical protein
MKKLKFIITAALLFFAVAAAQAQTTYNIKDVGSISSFVLQDAQGLLSEDNGVGFGSYQALQNANAGKITGSINEIGMFAEGDKLQISFTCDPASVYRMTLFDTKDIPDEQGNIIFTNTTAPASSTSPYVLTFTRTDYPLTGSLSFALVSNSVIISMVMANNAGNHSDIWIDGFDEYEDKDLHITFPNTPRVEFPLDDFRYVCGADAGNNEINP